MAKFKLDLLKSLRGRALVLTSISSLIIISTIVIIQLFTTTKFVGKLDKNNFIAENKNYVDVISNKLIKLTSTQKTLCENLGNIDFINMSNREKYSSELIKDALLTNEILSSVWILTEPYIFNNTDSLIYNVHPGYPVGLYVQYSKSNNLLGYNRNMDLDNISNEIANEYEKIKTNLQPQIIGPNEHDNLIHFIYPIINNKQLIGVVGFDISIRKLNREIRHYNTNNLENIVVSNTNVVLEHPNNESLIKLYSNLYAFTEENEKLYSRTQRGVELTKEIFIKGHQDKDKKFVLALAVKTGFPNIYWTVISYKSLDIIEKHQTRIVFNQILVGVLAVVLFLVLALIVSILVTRPFKILKDVILKIAEGNYEQKIREIVKRFSSKDFNDIADALVQLSLNLKEVSNFVLQIKNKKYNYKYKPLSENDILGQALIELNESLKKAEEKEKLRAIDEQQMSWTNIGIAKFSDLLRNTTKDIQTLSDAIISELVPYIKTNQGGIFIKTIMNDEEVLELMSVYAYDRKRYEKKYFPITEGIIGASALEKRTIYINNVPDNYVRLSSGLGKAKPSAVLITPLIFNNELFGVLEFASFHEFEQYVIDFVEKISQSIASAIATVKINQQTNDLLKQSEKQSEELKEQQMEMQDNIKKMEEAQNKAKLRENEFNSLINGLNKTTLMAEFGIDANVLSMNTQYATNLFLNVDDAKRKSVYEVFQIPIKQYDVFKKTWSKIINGETVNYEFKLINKDNKINILSHFTPLYNSENQVKKILSIGLDITELRNKEDELNNIKSSYDNLINQVQTKETELVEIKEQNTELEHQLNRVKSEYNEINEKLIKAYNSAQFFKKELEKRINKFRKIEKNLKEKIKTLENK